MAPKTEITREDIMSMDDYAAERADRRRRMTEAKRHRRLGVGPDATFYFENYETMWHQVHEMLFIERGGDEQVADELTAYNPLIPNGRELVTTLMFEIDEPVRREAFLAGLGGVEETVTITLGDEVIRGIPEEDVDRTSADGKASSVQFLHFPFTDAQVALFRDTSVQAVLGIGHEKYAHMAVLPAEVRAALSADFSD